MAHLLDDRQTRWTRPEQAILLPNPWVCPETGISVPTDLEANRRFRRSLLDQAAKDKGLQRELIAAAARSPFLFFNVFLFTRRQRKQSGGKTVLAQDLDLPFVLWAVQYEALQELAIHLPYKPELPGEGGTIVEDKGREMGATWITEGYLLHQWRFIPGRNFLMMSRKEELVDEPHNIDTLFGKLDYMIRRLPSWMIPKIDRAHMRLVNLENQNQFQGETTSKYAGHAQRVAAAMVDEAAKIENLREIERSLGSTAVVRLLVSTPVKNGVAFSDIRNNPNNRVITLHWSRHPEKAEGRQLVNGAWTSPWYEKEAAEHQHDPLYMPLEHDINHSSVHNAIFPAAIVSRHRAVSVCEPVIRGSIVTKPVAMNPINAWKIIKKRRVESVGFQPAASGNWKLWVELEANGRPPQDDFYIFFADIGAGVGAANSTIAVGSMNERRTVAMFASPTLLPEEFAAEYLLGAIWFGGVKTPLLGWEANGIGEAFGIRMSRSGWPSLYRQMRYDKRSRQRTMKLGWFSTPTTKLTVLERLRDRMGNATHQIHDEATIRECEQFIQYEDGNLGLARLEDMTEKARAAHADRVIANAGLLEVMSTCANQASEKAKRPASSRTVVASYDDAQTAQWSDAGANRWR